MINITFVLQRLEKQQLSVMALSQTIIALIFCLHTVNCRHSTYFRDDNHNSHYQQQKVSNYVASSPVATHNDISYSSNRVGTDDVNDNADANIHSAGTVNKLTLNVDGLLHEILDGNKRLMKRNKANRVVKLLSAALNSDINNDNNDCTDSNDCRQTAKSKRGSYKFAYPSIMTDSNQFNKQHDSTSNDVHSFDVAAYKSLVNQLSTLENSKTISENSMNNKKIDAIEDNSTSTNNCNTYIDSTNATSVLERVLQELELIKSAKMGNMTPEGAPCEIINIWNSEIIGLQFNISFANSFDKEGLLNVALMNHTPPKETTLMDANWTCSGYTLHKRGGPFYLTAIKKHKEVMATFTGICKTCAGTDTIFGAWNFVHTPKDCRDLQMFIETKRDIFRKDILHLNNEQKKRKNITSTTTTTTTTTNPTTSTTEKPNSIDRNEKETKTLLDEFESYIMNNY